MSFGEAIKSVFSKYATFSGRARRSEYWYFFLFTFLVGIVASFIPIINLLWPLAIFIPTFAVSVRRLHDTGKSGWCLLLLILPYLLLLGYVIYFFISIVMPYVGTSFADLNYIDSNTITELLKNNVTSLLIIGALELINFVALIIWIVWMCKDSEPGTNQYGPNPKETSNGDLNATVF